jgi:hypothetical protein
MDAVQMIRSHFDQALLQIRLLGQFWKSLKNENGILVFSFVHVDFKFGTSLIMIMKHV